MPSQPSTALAQAFRCPFCRLHRGPGMGEELCRCSERKKSQTPGNQAIVDVSSTTAPAAPRRARFVSPVSEEQQTPATPGPIVDGDEDETIIADSSPQPPVSRTPAPLPTGNLARIRDMIARGILTPPKPLTEPPRSRSSKPTADDDSPETGMVSDIGVDNPFLPVEDSGRRPCRLFARRNSADAPEVVVSQPSQHTEGDAQFVINGLHLENQQLNRTRNGLIEELESSTGLVNRLRSRNQVIEATTQHMQGMQAHKRKTNGMLGGMLVFALFLIVMYAAWCWFNASDFAYIGMRRGQVLTE